ncbi:MAG: carboxypeptidase regulatory-like domain-containing protein, partial [Vicinamibacterales bacterium]
MMGMMGGSSVGRAALVGLVWVALWPAPAEAQTGAIAGVVRDASGGVLPGVTVEAASPALIEKLRSVVTDTEGRYNIVDLRPGEYAVTFTLEGFNTLKRDGITLSAGFTAAVNADLQVGALSETITVSGAAPLVDTQNVRQQQVVSAELLETLPSGAKGFMGLARLVPGMSGGADSGGASGLYSSNSAHNSTVHGKGGARMSYDGMQTSNLSGTGHTSYIMNPSTVEETTVMTGGISAESDAAGLTINLVPKEGGNTFKGMSDGTFANDQMQSTNLNDTLRSRGVDNTSKVLHLYDFNFTYGGPVKRDRLWFFTATRFTGNQNQVIGAYFNTTRGTPFYTPDLSRPNFRKEWLRSQAARLTWQATSIHKINVFADVQQYEVRGRGQFTAPEATQHVWSFWPNGLYQVVWNAPLTNKLLLEAGTSFAQNGYPYTHADVTDIFGFTVSPSDVPILEASTGFRYNAKDHYAYRNDQDRYVHRFSTSYVTGTHAFKAGVQLQQGVVNQDYHVNSDGRNASCAQCPVQYTFLNGSPIQIVQWATPYLQQERVRADMGIYAQDQWNIRRLTLNLGLRFDYYNAYTPEQRIEAPASGWFPARTFAPVYGLPDWSDLNPRIGGSYDLFGNGRTALKASIGRYVGKIGTAAARAANPITTSVNSVNRAWNDADQDYVPDCDLGNFGANGECGPISNVNFGGTNPNAVRYSDELLRGFGRRDYFWDLTAEFQHELRTGISVRGGYYRTWTDIFGTGAGGSWPTGVRDNLAIGPEDFQPYCITAPLDTRLPGGGGYPVCGLYDIVPQKFGVGNEVITRASEFGPGQSRTTDFFMAAIDMRLPRGLLLGANVDTGRIVEDNCFVTDSPQALLYCRVVSPFKGQTGLKINGSLPLPLGFSVSGVLQNTSGLAVQANMPVPNAMIAPSLGRNLAACGTRTTCTATATVPLIAPQTLFEPRR